MEDESGSGDPFGMESREGTFEEGWSGQTWREEPPAHLEAGQPIGKGSCPFEAVRDRQAAEGLGGDIWGPFANEDEWELAQWLIKNVGQNQAEKFLNLNVVSLAIYLQ